jgi:hypothetical protein
MASKHEERSSTSSNVEKAKILEQAAEIMAKSDGVYSGIAPDGLHLEAKRLRAKDADPFEAFAAKGFWPEGGGLHLQNKSRQHFGPWKEALETIAKTTKGANALRCPCPWLAKKALEFRP